MTRAWLKGHTFDLDTLAELFFDGDPTVGVDSEGYFWFYW
jgi:hypothetical protein